jgi:PKD repeat protein
MVVQAEYFVDSDPGVSNGIAIPITSSNDVLDQIGVMSNYTEGFHKLCLRFKGESGIWSNTTTRNFYQIHNSAGTTVQIAEYFFDVDPGIGNGQPIALNPGSLVSVSASIPQSLSLGVHRLYVRFKSDGAWSNLQKRMFFVQTPVSDEVVAAEYYIDSDPGVGLGEPVAITSGSVVNTNFVVNNPYDQGTHAIFLRVKSANGNWSLLSSQTYTVCDTYGAVADFNFFVNSRQVIFTNTSQYQNAVSWNFGDAVQSAAVVNPSHIYSSPGNYQVCLTASNACATNTLCKSVAVNGLQSMSPNHCAQNSTVVLSARGFNFLATDVFKLTNSGGAEISPNWISLTTSSDARAQFDLTNTSIGFYDFVLLSSNGNDTLHHAFEIQNNQPLPTALVIIGSGNVRNNRTSYPVVHLTNPSNEPIYLEPLVIEVPAGPNVSILPPTYPDPLVPQDFSDFSQTEFYTYNDNITGESKQFAVIGVVGIPPGGSVDIPIAFNSESSGCFDVVTHEFVQKFPNGPPDAPCNFLSAGAQCTLRLLGLVPVAGCGVSTFNLTCTVENMITEGEFKFLDLASNFGGTIADCVGSLVPEAAFAGLLEKIDQAGDLVTVIDACSTVLNYDYVTTTKTICSNASNDPNMKYGPQGRTPENYVNRSEALNYSIHAENLESATAPASSLIIVDTLDMTKLDLSRIEMNFLQIADSIFNVHVSASHYEMDIHLTTLPAGYFVRYVYDFNVETGVMTHSFATYDSLNFDVINDPSLGFLPPNINGSEGELAVGYEVWPVANISHLDVIRNKASIVFDANQTIETPFYINTIDAVKPISTITDALIAGNDSTAVLHFAGVDAHSLVKDYFLSVSENNGPYQLLLGSIPKDSVIFAGNVGNHYDFKLQARDYANNIEDMPAAADASIDFVSNVNEVNTHIALFSFPNPVQNQLNLKFSPPAANGQIRLFDTLGNEVFIRSKVSGTQLTLGLENLASGVYVLTYSDKGQQRTTRIVKQ